MYAIGPEIKGDSFISVLESSTILFDHDCIYENSSVVVVCSETTKHCLPHKKHHDFRVQL